MGQRCNVRWKLKTWEHCILQARRWQQQRGQATPAQQGTLGGNPAEHAYLCIGQFVVSQVLRVPAFPHHQALQGGRQGSKGLISSLE
jgi:hypothetical protein